MIALSALSIRDLDDRVKERLRVRAARHGRSMEAEVRAILTDAVAEPGEAPGLFEAIMDRFGVRTKTAAVDLALRYLAGQPLTREQALQMRGARAIEEVPLDASPRSLT